MPNISQLQTPNGTTYTIKDTEARNGLADKQAKATTVTSTLLAATWSNGTYSFESTYPSSSYDILIEPDGNTLTADQYAAWSKAQIVGNSATNVIKALGTVPAINIPIQIRVIPK